MVTKVTILFHIFAMTETGFLLKKQEMYVCPWTLQYNPSKDVFRFQVFVRSNFTIAILTNI